jgi:hypothetical protein
LSVPEEAPTTVVVPAVLSVNVLPDILIIVLPSINEFEPVRYNLLYAKFADPIL